MNNKFLAIMAGIMTGAALLTGCSTSRKQAAEKSTLARIDMTKWLYNSEDNVYYQTGISYVANPADSEYESLGLYVPGAYFTGKENGDGTYTVSVNKNGTQNGFTVEDAPYVIPIETPGYSAMSAPDGYPSAVKEFTDSGLIFIYSGARGREHGAPAGVTDFKAAIRYVRYNKNQLPGDTVKIFSFGMSGGGAQSAILGASGDSPLYDDYLAEIGAVMTESDAIYGSMDWCPITNLNVANEAYEWELSASRDFSDEFTKDLSDRLAEQFAIYINQLGLKDQNGNTLSLSNEGEGIYQSGSYYDYLLSAVEESLNTFLESQTFPYDPSVQQANTNMPMLSTPNFGGRGPADFRKAEKRTDAPEAAPQGMPEQGERKGPDFENIDNVKRTENTSGVTISGVYETVQDYIDALNANGKWVIYNPETNTAKITSLADFSKAVKNATKSVGAFDDLNASQGENTLFGYNDGKGAHWDPIMGELLKGSEYEEAWTEDLAKTDSLGKTVAVRANMYNPLYYISDYYEGSGSSTLAKYWRIRSGIFQGDTAVSTELILATALQNAGVENVDFQAVWGLKHVQAEVNGTPAQNFIQWVISCSKD